MLIYRFRITSTEHDGFLREIDIQPNQTFLDFHHILTETSELLHCERAYFFTTDKLFKKEKEISLKPEKRQVRKYDEDLDQVTNETVVLPQMKTEKVKSYIEDPHQKLIYEFTGREFFAFHIELYRILATDEQVQFPRCLKRNGELPKKAEQPAAPATPEPSVPKVQIPKVKPPLIADPIGKLEGIEENEEELAAIENDLDALLGEVTGEADENTAESSEGGMEDFLLGSQSEQEEDEEEDGENLDHLDDYEDIENLDKRLSGFDRDSDDY